MLPDLERLGLWWGPGIVVLVIFGYGVLRLAHYWIEKSHEVKRQQVESIFALLRQYIEQFLHSQGSQADALSRLATSVEHRESVDSFEHQEILIALKAIHRDLGTLYCRREDPPCALRLASPCGTSPGAPSPGTGFARAGRRATPAGRESADPRPAVSRSTQTQLGESNNDPESAS